MFFALEIQGAVQDPTTDESKSEFSEDEKMSSPVFYSDAFSESSDDDAGLEAPFPAVLELLRPVTVIPAETEENRVIGTSQSEDSQIPGIPNLVHSDCVEKTRKTPPKNRMRRKHRCTFCDLDVGDFARHLQRNHPDEIAVQEAFKFAKKTQDRKRAIDKLRKEGDFCSSSIVPVLKVKGTDANGYLPCKFCRGYYYKKSLRRHVKRCPFNPDPSKPFQAQSAGHTLMCGHFGPNDLLRTRGLLEKLAADDVSLVAKKDPIICEVGRRYLRSHKDDHLLIVAKRYMRRLSRLLIEVRNIRSNKDLKMLDILEPTFFKTLIEATRNIAEYDDKTKTYKSPSLALQMGTLIGRAVNTAYSLEIQKTNAQESRIWKLNAVSSLIEKDWAHEISTSASQNLNMNKFNKPLLVPATQDVMVCTTINFKKVN